MKRLLLLFLIILPDHIFAQDIVLENVLKPNRDKLFRNIVNNSINRNLSIQLTDSTEENWEDAFGAIAFINYRSPWIDNRLKISMDSIHNRSISFQRAMLELIYSTYPSQFNKEVKSLLDQTNDTKIFAMCAICLLKNTKDSAEINALFDTIKIKCTKDPGDPILNELLFQLTPAEDKKMPPYLNEFLEKKYLQGNTLLISFQRQNRNYPGLVMVRDGDGNFIKEADGAYFSVPQLARSISNLPGYLTNGNTPEGIFRMDGFDHSKGSFIGPTTNIQLTMPFEFKASHFYENNVLADTAWNINRYKNLLPENFRQYYPMLQAYHAGKAGRKEIIAHGTTIDPAFFKTKPFFPLTPTQGCLSTKEIWSETTGRLLESDQQKLSNAIIKAGGPHGYAIVINIDDKQEPVTINDIIPFLKLAMQK